MWEGETTARNVSEEIHGWLLKEKGSDVRARIGGWQSKEKWVTGNNSKRDTWVLFFYSLGLTVMPGWPAHIFLYQC